VGDLDGLRDASLGVAVSSLDAVAVAVVPGALTTGAGVRANPGVGARGRPRSV
jgi:hypothetical protein